ncbi:MAG TPA: histidine kinase N-terminal 7TM domain-containing protein [Bacillota bacterium]|nr:histidine kinase N-terminal 7TM domain-containing protein [Bacillota bacterium]
MNTIILLPLLTFIICLITWSYILAQNRKSPVNRAYLVLSGVISGWNVLNLIIWSPIPRDAQLFFLRFSPLFWVPVGFLFLNFVYVVINKRRDYLYFTSLIITVIAVILCLASKLVVAKPQMNWFGYSQQNGPFYDITLIMVIVLPVIYALALVSRSSRRSTNRTQKKNLSLILWGGDFRFIGSLLH